MIQIDEHLVSSGATVKEALERLNRLTNGSPLTIFVVGAERRAVGSVTDGDIRRGLLRGSRLEDPVTHVMNPNFTALTSNGYGPSEIHTVKQKNIQLLPILDEQGSIRRLVNLREQVSFLPIDAVIMAGGEGQRLRPLTDKVPKPLLYVGDKPILEHNIDRLARFGVNHITITLNYLGAMIRDYFGDGRHKGVHIDYVEETEPLGTAGSLSLVDHAEHDTLLMMNSDLLTNIDLEDFYLEFRRREADLAVATIPYEVKVPYAVLETTDGVIHSFKEKPTYTYYSNGGIYLMRRPVVSRYIPRGRRYDATDLMEELIRDRHRVISYPLRGYWLDIGRHEDYERAQEDIKHVKL